MGKKWTSGFTDLNFKRDIKPFGHPKSRIEALKEDMNPQAPEPTDAEKALEGRQREELANLDEEENMRLKRGLRGRLGSRMLSARRPARSNTVGGSTTSTPTVRVPREPRGSSTY